MQENYPANIAALTMEQSLRLIVISLEMAKVEDLKQVIIGSQAFVIPVIRKSTKVKGSQNPKGYRCLRMRTVPLLVNFLNKDLLPQPKVQGDPLLRLFRHEYISP